VLNGLGGETACAGSDDNATVEAENWVDQEIAGCDFRDERVPLARKKIRRSCK
jgi:hypothetical protein